MDNLQHSALPSVLVVDDEIGLRNMLAFSLPERGYRVIQAANGEEAIEKIQRETVDLVLCDIMMPGKDGVEVLEAIKKIQPETEVIMATGYATLESAIESMKKGAYDYIAKPYTEDQLCFIFEKALERRRLKKQVGRLEQLHRAKSESFLTMSREMQAPMKAIIENSSLLLNRKLGDVNPRQEERLKSIFEDARNLLSLINTPLDSPKTHIG